MQSHQIDAFRINELVQGLGGLRQARIGELIAMIEPNFPVRFSYANKLRKRPWKHSGLMNR